MTDSGRRGHYQLDEFYTATDAVWEVQVAGDTFPRLQVLANGNVLQGTGAAALGTAFAPLAPSITALGTSATLTASAAGGIVTTNPTTASADIVVTIPANATVPWPVGTRITVISLGTSACSIAGAAGAPGTATISTASAGLVFTARYGRAELIKTATNTWIAASAHLGTGLA